MTRIDLTTLAEDDQLLDALGRGETPDGEDQVATLLGDWRAALPETCPVEEQPRRPRRRGRYVAAAVVVLVAAGGVTAAAEHAEPDSPLWPVTRLLYSDLADSRAARQAADEAVTVAAAAIEGGRYDDATELLDQADALVAQVDEPATAHELRSRIATVRAQIATATSEVTSEVTDEITEGVAETPVPPSAADPPPATEGPPPAATPDPGPGPGPDNDSGNGNGNDDPPRADPPPGLPTVAGLPTPGVGPRN